MVKTLSDPQQVWYSIECLYIELILLQIPQQEEREEKRTRERPRPRPRELLTFNVMLLWTMPSLETRQCCY